ncbi:MAG: BON domain-containing protein [Bacteroidota bacterium]
MDTLRNLTKLFSIPVFILMLVIFAGSCKDRQQQETTVIPDEIYPEDSLITNTVNKELAWYHEINSKNIEVETDAGIVTLNGTVKTLLAKRKAEEIASMVRGVRGIINMIDVQPVTVEDSVLKRKITTELLFDPAIEKHEINVEARDGMVKLTGTVDSWQEKELAEEATEGLKGVKDIINNIDFVSSTEDRSDEEIEAEITATLENDIRVDDALLDVKVKDGIVTLSGTVKSVAEKSQALADAWVNGVKDINSEELEVKYWPMDENIRKEAFVPKDDETIKKAIKDAFLFDPRINYFEPEIEVDKGIVTLSGNVNTLRAKKAAGDDARNITGVIKVINNISVAPTHVASDETLVDNVSTAMEWDPFIEKYEITVEAEGGDIILRGTVDSEYEKERAEKVAARVNGVIEVHNELNINDYEIVPFFHYGPMPMDYDDFPASDAQVKSAIVSQLWWSPHVDENKINVEVDNGRAILTGKVDNWRERYLAEKNAYQGGAIEVVNKLSIEGEE